MLQNWEMDFAMEVGTTQRSVGGTLGIVVKVSRLSIV